MLVSKNAQWKPFFSSELFVLNQTTSGAYWYKGGKSGIPDK